MVDNRKIAIVHDWFENYAGSERVVEQMLACYPGADIFSLVDFLPEDQRGFLRGKKAQTSFIQKLPFSRRAFRNYLLLMPFAIEQFDLSKYDIVISSSHAVAKGVLTGPDQLHICMCYSPIRYAWDLQHQYLQEVGLKSGIKSWLARWILHKVRLWDVRTAHGVDQFIAISNFIARRIRRVYRRSSEVIYPPVDISSFSFCEKAENFYLAASRMVPYKKMPLIVEAFSRMPDKNLIVIGDGPELNKCRALATQNVSVMGWQPFEILKDHMQRAKAFVFAAEEDFGITPLEAQACGTPVIAFSKGAVRETIRGLEENAPTGVRFDSQTANAIIEAIQCFERDGNDISPNDCRRNASRFSPEIFRKNFRNLVEELWSTSMDSHRT